MRFKKEKKNEIKRFILENLEAHPSDITKFVVKNLNISRQTAYNHAKELEKEGMVEIQAKGRVPHYKLKEIKEHFTFLLEPTISEDTIWRNQILPKLPPLNQNVQDICNYGVTEMINNVIDHSGSQSVSIEMGYNANKIWFWIFDNGIGIFKKIQEYFKFEDVHHAILELHKGKLTSQPTNHSGQGIFFTSHMFDEFDILSGDIFFSGKAGVDYLLDTSRHFTGTAVYMNIHRASTRTVRKIFDDFSDDDYGFTKTVIPVKLMQFEGENLVSRSQAKRLITRFDKFKEVILDFSDVIEIGQAFADQIFRIFAVEHPNVNLMPINASENILKMINYTKNNAKQLKESVEQNINTESSSKISQTTFTSSTSSNSFKLNTGNGDNKPN